MGLNTLRLLAARSYAMKPYRPKPILTAPFMWWNRNKLIIMLLCIRSGRRRGRCLGRESSIVSRETANVKREMSFALLRGYIEVKEHQTTNFKPQTTNESL